MTTTNLADFQRTWVVRCEGHPFISHYAIMLYDLHSGATPVLYKQDATHEFAVVSLNPNYDHLYKVGIDNEGYLIELAKGLDENVLVSVEHIYQFRAAGNDEAEQRMIFMIDAIQKGRLPCDSDYYQLWDVYHPDAVSLRKG